MQKCPIIVFLIILSLAAAAALSTRDASTPTDAPVVITEEKPVVFDGNVIFTLVRNP